MYVTAIAKFETTASLDVPSPWELSLRLLSRFFSVVDRSQVMKLWPSDDVISAHVWVPLHWNQLHGVVYTRHPYPAQLW